MVKVKLKSDRTLAELEKQQPSPHPLFKEFLLLRKTMAFRRKKRRKIVKCDKN